MSVLDGPGEGTWSVFAMKVVEERDELRHKLAGEAAHIKSLEGLLVDAVRERDEALAQVARREREHEALLETAQKALARAERERDEARRDLLRVADALGLVSTDDTGRIGQVASVDDIIAEVRSIKKRSASRATSCSTAEFSERQRILAWIRARHALGSLDCSLSLMALDALRVVADEIERMEHKR